MSEAIEFRVPNDLKNLGDILDRLERYCEGLGMAPALRRDVRLALDEILTNVISHAWPDGGAHAAELRLSAADGVLTCVVLDDGVPFDPVAHPARPPPDSVESIAIGGLGLVLVRKLADRLEYARVGGRNRLELTKIFRPG
jgi:serine/threonine-protein kinase RsbW